MDIKSLLSQDTPVHTPSSNPQPHSPARLPNGSPYHPSPHTYDAFQSQQMPPPQRHASTSMDTLADLASMQQYQASVRSASTSLRNPELQNPVDSPVLSNPPNGSFPSTPTRTRSVSHLTRVQEPPQRSTPVSTPLSEGDLPIMEQTVILGEEAWTERIQSAVITARSIQDRVAIMELCAQAVAEEPSSPRLWQIYGDWMWILYKRSYDIAGVYESCPLENVQVDDGTVADQPWSTEDSTVGKEVFQWEPMLDIWRRGASKTQWHLDSSNLVWDPYLELLMFDFSTSPSPAKYADIYQHFHQRLSTPHRTWENTKNAFASFVARYDEGNIQYAVTEAGKLAQRFQSAYDLRINRENALRRAAISDDSASEHQIFEDYLAWEETHHRQKTARGWGQNLYLSLLQRATIRFPKDADFWLDFVTFLMEEGHDQNLLLEVAERATRYCPASGDLWSMRLYATEASGRPYKEIETVKHNSTSTGQLEDGSSMQELIKVESAWCGYLRRAAFSAGASEDSKDVAEVAIRSAIENVARVGRDKFGEAYQGDPEFRVERIFIKFLTQDGRIDDARDIWVSLERSHGDSQFYWDRRYVWEMTVWEPSQDRSVDVKSQSIPTMATAILKRAVLRDNMDWPEKVIELYLHHCGQHETAKALLDAQVDARRAFKKVARRRQNEQMQYQQQQAAYEQAYKQEMNGKRARSDDDVEMSDSKRARTDEPAEQPPFNDPSSSASAQLKRDRENTTVIVRHLPSDATELKIRQYFRDCGDINAVKVIQEDANAEASATIEFKAQEDVLTAQTKSMKMFGDKPIDVQVGTGTTIWVTNYPPEADETYLRKLFKAYGEIVELRFPSLKANTHRRFCYIQFLTSKQAAEASAALHGRALEHNHRLSALLSDPGKHRERQGATDEGREIYVGNFNWNANEADLRSLLESHGCGQHIETLRILRNFNGKSKGAGFVTFAQKQEAELAAQRLDKQVYRDRVLTVTIANRNAKGPKTSATTVVRNRRASTAASEGSSQQGGSADTPMGDADASQDQASANDAATRQSRTLALLNIPDTVNDARIQALCEPYGGVVKILLKPEHGGALIEFEEAESRNRALLSLEGHEIADGKRLRVGEAWEVLKGPTSNTDANTAVNASAPKTESKKKGMKPASVTRPAFGAGSRGRGRGRGGRAGLGFGRSNAAGNVARSEDDTGGGKSQDDFRALLGGGSEGAETSAKDTKDGGEV
ncbi:MAG: hypothetical protein Q9162_004891 [Coniocarpon cinnabarinum]